MKSDLNSYLVSTVFDFLAILFKSNQTDTHKTFLIKSEDFFLMQVKNHFFMFFFFCVEQVKAKFEELKREWFTTDSVESTGSNHSFLSSLNLVFACSTWKKKSVKKWFLTCIRKKSPDSIKKVVCVSI